MKKVNLIPIIEIWANSENIQFPEQGPYWKYPDEFEKAEQQCLMMSGYEPMKAYLKGSNFYRLDTISDVNLLLQIKERIVGYTCEEIYPFDGGYVLNVENKDMLYPQCCGDLSDIEYWKELSNGERKLFWQGHPQPSITIKDQKITFDLSPDNYEDFAPTPSERYFEVQILDLQEAVEQVIKEMQIFADRIDKLAAQNSLGINNLSDLLVWGTYPQ